MSSRKNNTTKHSSATNQPSSFQLKKDILNLRIKQTEILNQIKDDVKKIRENNISITGLEQLSPNSIKKMQEKRKKFLLRLKNSQIQLDLLLKRIIKLETKYIQILN